MACGWCMQKEIRDPDTRYGRIGLSVSQHWGLWGESSNGEILGLFWAREKQETRRKKRERRIATDSQGLETGGEVAEMEIEIHEAVWTAKATDMMAQGAEADMQAVETGLAHGPNRAVGDPRPCGLRDYGHLVSVNLQCGCPQPPVDAHSRKR